MPRNKTQRRLLERSLKSATDESPLKIYVGSCPDYSHTDGLYDHQSLQGRTPLLTSYHLLYDLGFLGVLARYEVPFSYTVMVADVEACDEVFCQKFTAGSEEVFLNLCRSSQRATAGSIQNLPVGEGIRKRIHSSSFFGEFGREKFLQYQESYQEVLKKRYADDGSFRMRTDGDTASRLEMYSKMYDQVLRTMEFRERFEFLTQRTLRTMAQYLTLGRLIAVASLYPVIINHPTKNIGVFNDRNKFALPEDEMQPQPTIPIVEMNKEVY